MTTIRRDGTWTIYQIEAWNTDYPEDSDNQYAKWFVPDIAKVTENYGWGSKKLEDRPRCIRLYEASGECWQQTGNSGFLDPELAHELLFFCVRYNRDTHRFRLVKRIISQQTTVILETPRG